MTDSEKKPDDTPIDEQAKESDAPKTENTKKPADASEANEGFGWGVKTRRGGLRGWGEGK